MIRRVEKSDREWREQLTAEQFAITRKGATERAFTGRYYHHDAPGTYHCICCRTPLFDAKNKYESGSGWPSFTAPVEAENVATRDDCSHGMQRTEARCAACDAHLGHVFPDGPPAAGGLRYCINSAALDFSPSEDGKHPRKDR